MIVTTGIRTALVVVSATMAAASPLAAQTSALTPEGVAALMGEWSGVYETVPVPQDILWRFDRMGSGGLAGFMGLSADGVATIPLQNIQADGTDLSFTVDPLSARFEGTTSPGRVTGTWSRATAGGEVVLRRPDSFTQGSGGGAYAPVLGVWEGRRASDPADGPPRTWFRIELGDDGMLIAYGGDDPGAITNRLESAFFAGGTLTLRMPAPAGTGRSFEGVVSDREVRGMSFEGIQVSVDMRRTGGG